MNQILKFDRVYYEKYNTSRINIENGILVLKDIVGSLKLMKQNMVIENLFYSWTNLIYAINKTLGDTNKWIFKSWRDISNNNFIW